MESKSPLNHYGEVLEEQLEGLRQCAREAPELQSRLSKSAEMLSASFRQLQLQCQRYRELFESAPHGYLVTDAAGIIQEANRSARDLLAIGDQALPGTSLAHFVPESHKEAFQEHLRQLESGEPVRGWSMPLKPQERPPIEAAIAVTANRDAAAGIATLHFLLRDITQRIQEEQERVELLQEAEQGRLEAEQVVARTHLANRVLSALVDTLPVGVIVCEADGALVRVNPAAEDVLGGGVEGTLERPRRSYSAHRPDGSSFPAQEMPLWRALHSGELVTDEEILIHRHDGTERLIEAAAAPVRDEGGQIVGGVTIFRDVTERKRQEEEQRRLLRESEQQRRHLQELTQALEEERDLLEAIMENTAAQLAYLDRHFDFVRVNSAYAAGSGYEKEALLGRNHFELFPHAENRAIFEMVRDTGRPARFQAKPFDYPGEPERGTTYWDWTLVPVKGEGGQTRGLVLSLTDVTDTERFRQQQEAHLQRLDSMIDTSLQILSATTVGGLMQCVVDAAVELTGARIGTVGHGYREGVFRVGAAARRAGASECPPGEVFCVEQGGVYMELIEQGRSIRLNDEQLRSHPAWWGLPEGHSPLRGLLGAPLYGGDGQSCGRIMVSDKEAGDFTAEDEALLTQLAALASLGLRHIEALSEVERRADELDTTFSAMSEAVVVYDREGMPIRANPAAVQVYGLDPLGMTPAARIAKLALRHPDGHPIQVSELPSQRALEGGRVAGDTFVLTDAQGHERSIVASSAPLFSAEEISGAVVVWHDTTEREEILAQLETYGARLNAVIENAPEGIVVADEAGRIVLANPAAEQLYAQSIPFGQDFEQHAELALCYPDGTPYDPRDLPLTRSALDGESFSQVEMAIIWPDGQRRELLVGSAPICDPQGQAVGAVGVFQDISQRKQIEQALQQRNRDLRLLNKLSRELSATLDIEQVFSRILGAVREVIETEASLLWLGDEEQPGWLTCAAWYPPEVFERAAAVRLGPGESIAGWVTQHKESAVVQQALGDERFTPSVEAQTGLALHSVLAVPLQLRDRVLGVLEVVNKQRGIFGAEDCLLLETLAGSAAVAIENARLYGHARQAAAAEERGRLARELHDAVSQTLFSASVIAESLPRLWERKPDRVRAGLEQLAHLTRGALAEMRILLLELRPAALLEARLDELLAQLVASFSSRSRIQVTLEVEGEPCAMAAEAKVALYRISQEALNNVIKHARASRADVHMYCHSEALELRICDDGRGFDPAHIPADRLGLRILSERAEAIGASLEISSRAGQGTQIVVTWKGGRRKERQ